MVKKVDSLDAIKSVMMLTDDALNTEQIGKLIEKHLGMRVKSSVIKSTLEDHPALFENLGEKWKLNIGID